MIFSLRNSIPRDVLVRTTTAEIENYMHKDVCVSINYNSK